MDALIEECGRDTKLDVQLVYNEFESQSALVKDTHVLDTLFSILDFLKFKEMMLAFQVKEQTPSFSQQNLSEVSEDMGKL